MRTKQSSTNDIGAGNIEKSLTYESNYKQRLNKMSIEEKLIGNRRCLTSRVKIYESASLLLSKRKTQKDLDRSAFIHLNTNKHYGDKKETYKMQLILVPSLGKQISHSKITSNEI